MSDTRRVELVAFHPDPLPPSLLELLRDALNERLAMPVVMGESLDLSHAFLAAHSRQLPSGALVDALIDRSDGDLPRDRWFLGVTGRDLIAPGRDFVFGEATVGGAWAVVSTARLGGDDGGTDLPAERLLKEAIHELGHLAGLDHCATPTCVMTTSARPEELDHKATDFCGPCATLFHACRALDREIPE